MCNRIRCAKAGGTFGCGPPLAGFFAATETISSSENVPLALPAGIGMEQLREMTGSQERVVPRADEKKGRGTWCELFCVMEKSSRMEFRAGIEMQTLPCEIPVAGDAVG